jgi:hypothetical protein
MSLRSVYASIEPQAIDKWDHYIDIYAKRLPKKGGHLKILEIGAQGGGSLKMWRRHFGRKAEIIGVDVDPRCLKIRANGISIIIGNQGDTAFLDRLIADHGPFDVIIDDGSHVGFDQITAFKRLIHHTRHLYFVEDTHTSYWAGWQPISESFIHYARGLIDDLHGYFIMANTPEVYGTEAWAKLVDGKDLGARNYLQSISFYDSMIVFEVGATGPPLRRRRGSAPK